MYSEDEATGMTYMAFSSDSTCATDLHSATQGYETLALRRVPPNSWPTRVVSATCMFPQWAQGKWEHVSVQRNSLTFRDHSEMRTYSVRCIGPDQGPSAERFPVYYKTQCGEEKYTCVWLKQRGNNVLEFQIGLQSSERFTNSMCLPNNFREKIWVTQGRTDRVQESPCPITGEYNGLIPDADGLCAKLSSDCTNPEVMYYTVSDCVSEAEVYEERPKPRYSTRHRREAAAGPDPDPSAAPAVPQEPAAGTSKVTAAPQHSMGTTASRIYRISSSPRVTSPPSPSADQLQEASWAAVSNHSTSVWGQRTDSTLLAYSVPQPRAYAPGPATAHGPMYPTSYNAHLNLTSSTSAPSSSTSSTAASTTATARSAPAYPEEEEEYDPWAFPKMHGLQTTARSSAVPPARPMQSRPVMYFNSQSGFRDPVRDATRESAAPNPFYYQGPAPAGARAALDAEATMVPVPPGAPAREVSIGWPTPRMSTVESTSNAGTLSGTLMGTVHGTALGGTYRGRPVEIPGLPPSPYVGVGVPHPRMRIVPMAVAVHSPRTALSARAPTDRGMEFGERASSGPYSFQVQERSSTPRRALQPHDSGWTLEGAGTGRQGGPPAPRSEARSAASPFRMEGSSPRVAGERQYRCLGQWKEGDRVYTYTQRKDVGTYECFVGSIISQTEIYIKEAGEHCERGVDPLQHGMLLRRKGACIGSAPVPQTSTTPRPRPSTQWPVTRRPVETHTKPWKPITAPPRPKTPVQSIAPSVHSSVLSLYTSIFIILLSNL
ncbi:Glucose starvation modulator protein 1 [Frankliniella fusca]|uniref:Glucose starvation modulator protein 1 n=1 Tax=Frankliniella fusca TaxID=407009 RepID=A0AAE1L8S9_9NEOP|nr:Glucose starvation modulator protein 1 [Frankliniella fusca]